MLECLDKGLLQHSFKIYTLSTSSISINRQAYNFLLIFSLFQPKISQLPLAADFLDLSNLVSVSIIRSAFLGYCLACRNLQIASLPLILEQRVAAATSSKDCSVLNRSSFSRSIKALLYFNLGFLTSAIQSSLFKGLSTRFVALVQQVITKLYFKSLRYALTC